MLLAEDSAVTREYLSWLLAQDPALRVAGTARDGREAVALVEALRPDIVLMDIHMPHLDGFAATRQIMERAPLPIVLISSSINRQETAMAFAAMEAGALAVVEKPRGNGAAREQAAHRVLDTVKLMAEVKVVRRWSAQTASPPRPRMVSPHRGRIHVVAIGASTGGPAAVAEILRGLPSELEVPILVVQHLAPGFVQGLADWLGQCASLAVTLAESDATAQAGTVYLAPDGTQMGITAAGRIRLSADPSANGFAPSASYLFRSVTEAYGATAMAVLLTGMGRDGAAELGLLREAGGVTVAQDEVTSVVFGMPGAAIRIGAAEHVLPPARIAELIKRLSPASRR